MTAQAAAPPVGLTLRSVRRSFGQLPVVDDIDLDVPPGQFLAILGPSGCGKSTLLRLIANLDRPTAGTISETSGSIAYVFQDAHLLPWRNLLSNVALPLELMGVPKESRLAAAAEAIAQVGLSDAADRYPAQLSGGMRMRASLARALITNPAILLLDEPFAALDEITRHRLDEQLHDLWLRRRMTVLFVTHSTTEAVFLAERAIVLSPRPARILADHPIYLPPERTTNLRSTPEFVHHTRLLYDALCQGGA